MAANTVTKSSSMSALKRLGEVELDKTRDQRYRKARSVS
jgi:hypothetical protein